MKRKFFTSAFLFSVLCISSVRLAAQTSRGDQLFGIMGTVAQQVPLAFHKSGQFNLFYQRFLTNRFSLGVNMNYGFVYGFYDTHWNSIGTGIEGRYYFLKPTYKFQPYVFGGLETNWSRTVYQDVTIVNRWQGIQANTGIGFDWYLRPNFALNARAQVNFMDIQSGHSTAGLNYKVGATFLIPHKEKSKSVQK